VGNRDRIARLGVEDVTDLTVTITATKTEPGVLINGRQEADIKAEAEKPKTEGNDTPAKPAPTK
jgi:hypothetical protein